MIFEKILYLREKNGLTQEKIAKILKTSQSNYSRWEKGTFTIPLTKLNLLCNYFQVSMDYIIGINEENIQKIKSQLNIKLIGKNIRDIRKKYNLTQQDLANFLNTSQSTISAYETGKKIILTDFAIQLVFKYNLSLDKLCGKTNKEIKS